MKAHSISSCTRTLTLALSLILAPAPWAGSALADEVDEVWRSQMQNIVKAEFQRTHSDLSRDVAEANARIQAYEGHKNEAISRAKSQHKVDLQGMKLLKEYEQLISTRYINKKGDFEAGLEVNTTDIQNVNDLAKTHLMMTPLSGRTSAGHARKTIQWMLKRLDEIADSHSSPSESNNPEVEVIAKLIRDEQARLKRATALLDELGLKPDPKVLAEGSLQQLQQQPEQQQQAAEPESQAAPAKRRKPANKRGQ